MKGLISLWFIISLISPAFAQQPQLLMERAYRNDSYFKGINASAITRQGNILLSGPARPSGGGGYENWFLLVNPNTDTLWTRKGHLLANGDQGISQTIDNGFIFYSTAYGQSVPQTATDMVLQKLNANGQISWTKYINQNNDDVGRTMLLMPDQGFLLAGEQMPVVSKKYLFTRTDSAGNILWQQDYSNGAHCGIVAMKFTYGGNILSGGYVQVNNDFNLKLVLTDQNGAILKAASPIVTNSGRSEYMGYTDGSITPLSDGGALITGKIDTSGFQLIGRIGFVLKVDQNLQKSWSYIRRNPTFTDFTFTKTKELADGTLLALAYTTGSNKFYIHHLSAVGSLLTIYPFTSSLCTQLQAITFDALNDTTFMIGGYATTTQGDGYYVAKVKIPGLPLPLPAVTITGSDEELITGALLGQSYPSPTATEAYIPYSLPRYIRKAEIIIREIATGREVKKYVLNRNESSLKIDVSQLRNGLFLYSLILDEKPVATKKLAVVK